MNIEQNEEIKRTIESKWKDKKLKFVGIKIFNTSWAKDNGGKKDTVNVAMFIEFECDGETLYYLPKQDAIPDIHSTFLDVYNFNRYNDNRALDFWM